MDSPNRWQRWATVAQRALEGTQWLMCEQMQTKAEVYTTRTLDPGGRANSSQHAAHRMT